MTKHTISAEELSDTDIWRDCVGFPKYKISRNGELYSCWRERLLSGIITKCGYIRQIMTPESGIRKHVFVHKLVADAFIPNPENKPQVNHINGIKTDNRIENLEWCTNSENQKHAWKTGLASKESLKNLKYGGLSCRRKVLCIETGIIYKSIIEASRKTGAHYTSISNCVRGRKKHAGGFSWKYFRPVRPDEIKFFNDDTSEG